MSNVQARDRNGKRYLYRNTSRWIDGQVKTETEYLGPEGKGLRQSIDEAMMRELSTVIMKPGLDVAELKRIAKKFELKMPPEEPRKVVLENNLLKKTLYVWIK